MPSDTFIKLISQLEWAIYELEIRGIVTASCFLAELLNSLSDCPNLDKILEFAPFKFQIMNKTQLNRQEIYAKSLFLTKEYKRCENILKGNESDFSIFLRHFCTFLIQKEIDQSNSSLNEQPKELIEIHQLFNKTKDKMDPFHLYLNGLILCRLDLKEKAKDSLKQSVKQFPFNWSAWKALLPLVNDRNDLENLGGLTSHWMALFFFTQTEVHFEGKEKSIELCLGQLLSFYPQSTYLRREKIRLAYDQRFFDYAQEEYEKVNKEEPFNLQGMDHYSNILFVKDCKHKLSKLAKSYEKVYKYRPESALISANCLSLNKHHEKAVEFFRRAIKLDPLYEDAWVLLGHEYIEVHKEKDAMKAYRAALVINGRNFRAWYGLGQIHEMNERLDEALYYFDKATTFKSGDSRMWNAKGVCLKKLGKVEDSIRCFVRAENSGDEENVAVGHLAEFYIKKGDKQNIIKYCKKLTEKLDEKNAINFNASSIMNEALLVLGKYEAERNDIEKAEWYLSRIKELSGTNNKAIELAEYILRKREEVRKIDVKEGSVRKLEFG